MPEHDKLNTLRTNLKEQFAPSKYSTFWDATLNPIGLLIQRIFRMANMPPFWANLLLLELLFLLLDHAVSIFIGEYHGLRLELIPLELFLVVISFTFIVSYKAHSDRLIEDCRVYLIDDICSETSLVNLGNLAALNTSKKGPILVGILFGLLWLFFAPSLVYMVKGGFLGWGPWLLAVLDNFVIGTGAYYFYLLMLFRIRLSRYELSLHGANPSQSTVMARLADLLFMPVLQVMLLSMLTTLAFSATGLFSIPTLSVAVLFGWIPMSVIFGLNHFALANIIKRAKLRKLIQIENMIEEIEAKNNSTFSKELEKLQKLTEYHDRIYNTPNSRISLQAIFTFINTLLLPLASFLLANLGTILQLVP